MFMTCETAEMILESDSECRAEHGMGAVSLDFDPYDALAGWHSPLADRARTHLDTMLDLSRVTIPEYFPHGSPVTMGDDIPF